MCTIISKWSTNKYNPSWLQYIFTFSISISKSTICQLLVYFLWHCYIRVLSIALYPLDINLINPSPLWINQSSDIVCQAFGALKLRAWSVTKLMDDVLDQTGHKVSRLCSGCPGSTISHPNTGVGEEWRNGWTDRWESFVLFSLSFSLTSTSELCDMMTHFIAVAASIHLEMNQKQQEELESSECHFVWSCIP